MNASVCLTVYNEEKGIPRMLRYLDTQCTTIDDIVIVSDNCHDNTDELIARWSDHKDQVIFMARSERKGRASAIRLGLSQTRNDLVIILAGDIQPLPECFTNLLAYFQDETVGAVTGHPILLNAKRTIADCLSHVIWTSHDASRQSLSDQGKLYHLSGEVLAIRKHALKGFENYSGLIDDAMIGFLIKRQGYRVLFGSDVQYYMQYPSTLKGYLKVRKRCCYGRVELKHKMHIKDNPYYELTHHEYVSSLLKIAFSNPKYLYSLLLGIPLEALCRIYYTYKLVEDHDLYDSLWNPAIDTKW